MSLSLSSQQLLVFGYVRKQTRELKINIIVPSEVILLIYHFRKMFYEAWYEKYKDDDISIDKQCIRINTMKKCTIYGKKVIKAGVDNFSWKLRINQGAIHNDNWFHIYVGLVKNKKALLSNLPNGWYNREGEGWQYSGYFRRLYGHNVTTYEKYGEYFYKKHDT